MGAGCNAIKKRKALQPQKGTTSNAATMCPSVLSTRVPTYRQIHCHNCTATRCTQQRHAHTTHTYTHKQTRTHATYTFFLPVWFDSSLLVSKKFPQCSTLKYFVRSFAWNTHKTWFKEREEGKRWWAWRKGYVENKWWTSVEKEGCKAVLAPKEILNYKNLKQLSQRMLEMLVLDVHSTLVIGRILAGIETIRNWMPLY